MSAHGKKLKVDTEYRVFNKTRQAVCLVCREQVAVLKDYNLNRHYGTKHADKYKNLTDAEWARATDGLLVKLQTLMITCQLSFALSTSDIQPDALVQAQDLN